MIKLNNIFLSLLPQLDLHGYDRESAIVLVNDFIEENTMLGKNKVVIIHGIGSGIIKNTVHSTLSSNKQVISFNLDRTNLGCTIVNLQIKNI
ncbi:MAG: Smr/MutS family protein [bacterium]|nr:Smr/MutS family protein [bacterium]